MSKDAGRRVRALIGRLLAEGAKAGVRVVLVVQRAEAALMGAFERAQCSVKVSFRSDNPAAVELLHPGAARDVAEAHVSALPGVGLLSVPGAPLTRFRAPHVGSYADYAEKIRASSASRGPVAA
ncbi:hypothetical protein [Pseudonocardia sp. ICBG601]|uniref:hypothetical protein n=1 Tax=Pseudonocardia sp. ICBG601 TaxID=2846759 RepID=UPI001CF67C1E|nr:hypothetical protein [Pseudonocardia sp. ICBG601]